VTCIVGVQTPAGVVIGGDSAGLSGWVRTHRADPKVFANGSYLVGFTTSYRMGQVIRYADLPKPLDRCGDELERFLTTEFVDGVRAALKDAGWAKKDNEREDAGTFLLGVNGRLFKVSDDYQVGWTRDGYDACGSGWEVALGALHATRTSRPATRVRKALEAAAHHSGSVHGPFTVLSEQGEESR
jgi:ATP-dependent protease HslVU (ClpYQ) peptidase subunit